jgi:hypothetical protein
LVVNVSLLEVSIVWDAFRRAQRNNCRLHRKNGPSEEWLLRIGHHGIEHAWRHDLLRAVEGKHSWLS